MPLQRVRTAREAVRDYLTERQLMFSCVARVPAIAARGPDGTLNVQAGNGLPLELQARGGRISFLFEERLEIDQNLMGCVAVTSSYAYSITVERRELLSYHWHPSGRSHVTEPHLHLGEIGGTLGTLVTGRHLPTGEVSLQQFLLFLVSEVGVRPLRDDWQQVLSSG